jgi:hypothetical protein
MSKLRDDKIVITRPVPGLFNAIVRNRIPSVLVNAPEREIRDGWLQFILTKNLVPAGPEAALARQEADVEALQISEAANAHGIMTVGSVKHAVRVPTRFLRYISYRRTRP